jgi:hypothetical protein
MRTHSMAAPLLPAQPAACAPRGACARAAAPRRAAPPPALARGSRGVARAAAAAAAATPPAAPPPRLADPLLVGIGVDDADTGGTQFAQSALTDALVDAITSGRLACDAASLGEDAAAQAAAARELLGASGVRRRGSQRGARDFFVTTKGLPSLAADALLERLEAAAARALARWAAGGGEGAAGITHLVLGSLTPPRSAPGAAACAASTAPAAAACAARRARRRRAPRAARRAEARPSRARAGPDVALMSRLGLPSHTQRIPQHHLGCHGGLRCLALAAQIARGNPQARRARARTPRSSRVSRSARPRNAESHAPLVTPNPASGLF